MPGAASEDLYKVLGVRPDAEPAAVTSAFRRLARELHPDRNPDPAAEERFKAVGAAYEVLGNAQRRADYDARRRTRPAARAATSGGYDRSGRRAATAQTPRGPRADEHALLEIDLARAMTGGELQLTRGFGAPVKVRLPAGIADGDLVRIPGRAGGGGDLLITVTVIASAPFALSGRDVTVAVEVPAWTAAAGGVVAVPLPTSGSVSVRLEPGTPAGRHLRVRGRGLPARGDLPAGDLHVTVLVCAPAPRNDRQRGAWEALRAAYESPAAGA